MKKSLSILLALAIAFSLAACSSGKKTPPAADPQPAEEAPAAQETETAAAVKSKVFDCEEMEITLTDDFFREEGIDTYTGVFESNDAAIFVLREDKSLLPGVDMDQYTDLVLEANKNAGREVGELHRKDGIPLFEYDFTNPQTNQAFTYYTTMFESEDAFWLVQFTCYADKYKEHISQFHEFARSVTFDE